MRSKEVISCNLGTTFLPGPVHSKQFYSVIIYKWNQQKIDKLTNLSLIQWHYNQYLLYLAPCTLECDKLFSAPLECKQSRCLSTTPVCSVEKDVDYKLQTTGDNLNPPIGHAGTGDAAGCKSYCRSTFPDAELFTWVRSTDHCWCKTAGWTGVNNTDTASGVINCDDSGKIITFRAVIVVDALTGGLKLFYHCRFSGSKLGWISRRRIGQGSTRDMQERHEDEPRLDNILSRGDVQQPWVGARSRRWLFVCPRWVR